jgi:hypothetical protein
VPDLGVRRFGLLERKSFDLFHVRLVVAEPGVAIKEVAETFVQQLCRSGLVLILLGNPSQTARAVDSTTPPGFPCAL